MNKQELQDLKDKIACWERKIALIEERLKEQEELQLWVPKIGDKYYMLSPTGIVITTSWENDIADKEYLKAGLIFKTKEEATIHARKMRVFTLLMQFSDIDGSESGVCVYCPEFNLCDNNVRIADCVLFVHAPYCFSTKEKCQQAIDFIGEKEVYFFLTGKEME